jgi:peptide/nickel transport system substrate-binding protein
MIDLLNRTTKLKWRRRFRRSKRQVEDLGVQAEEQLEQHLFRRLNRLASVRRFVVSWVFLFALLIAGVIYQITSLSQYYQTLRPAAGGVYTEGILGSFTNANPLYATGPVDSAVSRLIFDGLFKYDDKGRLVNDLAQSWSVDDKGATYTVKLRPNLLWQDDAPLTAADVVFTYKLAQNPDAKSPLLNSWQGIDVSAPDATTIVFKLPNALVSFPYSLTTGIVPRHLLVNTPAQQLRAIPFNTVNPVGSGPFAWEALEVHGETQETRQEQIALSPNTSYFAGAPKLQQFKIRSFLNEKAMINSYKAGELTAMSGLDAIPDDINNAQAHEYSAPLTGAVGVFFRTSQDILGDAKVRQALVQSVNIRQVLASVGYPVIPVNEPFLRSQFPYDPTLAQLPYNVDQANGLLDSAGWAKGKDGLRYKNGRPLSFQLFSQSTSEYAQVTKQLQTDWLKVGINVIVLLQPDSDLHGTVAKHDYDALLYGISIGQDPDVFAYWGSTQASVLSNRFNFSEYRSATADKALEAGRTRTDLALRTIKYKPFLSTWRQDAPALMLYQPRYLYITSVPVSGLNMRLINNATDRYTNVANWMILQSKVNN